MILDTEIQRKVLIDALNESNIKGSMAREMVKLLEALENATIESE